MLVVDVKTSYFNGEILAINHEPCGKNGKGVFSLWDITDPLDPRKLTENFGDFPRGAGHDAHRYHSVFVWDAGDRACLVATNDEEALDVDIYDITNPKKPVLITELDLNDFGISQPELGLTDSFLHDMVVKQIDGDWIMLLSYWDGGWVLLNAGEFPHL